MRKEKIILLYPTVVKEGLPISHYMQPDPVFYIDKFPSTCALYLTSVMYFDRQKKYTTELDIRFNGKSVLNSEKQDENSMETFMFNSIDEDSFMVGSSLLVKNINVVETGVYNIYFKLYEDINGELSGVLDEKTCSFISVTTRSAES